MTETNILFGAPGRGNANCNVSCLRLAKCTWPWVLNVLAIAVRPPRDAGPTLLLSSGAPSSIGPQRRDRSHVRVPVVVISRVGIQH
jgi:hypothetical protein